MSSTHNRVRQIAQMLVSHKNRCLECEEELLSILDSGETKPMPNRDLKREGGQ